MKVFSLASQAILIFSISMIVLVLVVLFSILGWISLPIDILLTFVIGVFTFIQGFSIITQIQLENTHNRTEDEREDRRYRVEYLRNELEKAYGQLYRHLEQREYSLFL